MKYFLKCLATNEITEFNSLTSISKALNTTYASVYKSYLYDIKPETKKGKKQSQKQFDERYQVSINPFLTTKLQE